MEDINSTSTSTSTSNKTDEFLKTFNEQIKNYQLKPDPNQLIIIKSSLNQIAKEIPSYHLKNCIKILTDLSTHQPTHQEKKPKFSFKRIQPQLIIDADREKCKPNEDEPKESSVESEPNHNGTQIVNQTGIVFKPNPISYQTSSISFLHINHSILDLRNMCKLKSISIQGLSNSIVILDHHLDGSFLISFSIDSILIFSSNQIRVHDSYGLWFWVERGTIPIIERSKSLHFTSKSSTYPVLQVLDFSQPVSHSNQSLNYRLDSSNAGNVLQDVLGFVDRIDGNEGIEDRIQEFMKRVLVS
ncbi:uncharacterized protein MELLADRAFT_70821 [Melampsora larici-populina 98AG31]|uniref:C-CAP/cofactor C-like domain-containing protein n=1 Tax=Melampsora larici-populina (strain 98AG31 / pathotype 3-4-7) TaxID=747676 RepID=F4R8B3_MELLP|nr:uncharacterized protein MELLADRAFT_70821 [Melampsora larici-populina 98AG31]EGG11459.1 hypothetical protein MELLADRAFT_70821 [Melampsora larici-populina 98AG31]